MIAAPTLVARMEIYRSSIRWLLHCHVIFILYNNEHVRKNNPATSCLLVQNTRTQCNVRARPLRLLQHRRRQRGSTSLFFRAISLHHTIAVSTFPKLHSQEAMSSPRLLSSLLQQQRRLLPCPVHPSRNQTFDIGTLIYEIDIESCRWCQHLKGQSMSHHSIFGLRKHGSRLPLRIYSATSPTLPPQTEHPANPEQLRNLPLPTTTKPQHPKLLQNPPKPETTMSTNRCQQILAEVDNDVTMAVYRIFSEAEINENIKAKNWEDFAAGLNDGDKRRVDEVFCNLTHAWVQCAPCANLVALVRWRRDARGLVARV